jgi:GT2 family glycosyltransferase
VKKQTKTIAVLLTCHNRKTTTLACLAALYNNPLPEDCAWDVYLVDDGCSDGTPQAIKAQFPQVKVIQGNGNLFWNRGMHLAWETAAKTKDYDYYLWLNDDTILYTCAIDGLIHCSKSENNQAIICGSTCAIGDKNKITYGGWTRKGDLIQPNGEKKNCNYFNGNIVLIPQLVYKTVGTNDPVFRHALGDFDYGLRAKKLNIRSVIAPVILGECDGHLELAAWCNPQTPLLRRLKLLYTPLGNHPVDFFRYKRRHSGFHAACFYFFMNHLRATIPALWKIKQISI